MRKREVDESHSAKIAPLPAAIAQLILRASDGGVVWLRLEDRKWFRSESPRGVGAVTERARGVDARGAAADAIVSGLPTGWLRNTSCDRFVWVRGVDRLRAAERVLTQLEGERPQIYGVDPDYFHSVVRLRTVGSPALQRFALGLKKSGGVKARIKNWFKRLLIALDHSNSLYESFVLLLPSVPCGGLEWLTERLPLDSAPRSRWALLPITSCLAAYGNDLVLAFVEGGTDPLFVFKAARSERFGSNIVNEVQALAAASQIADLSGKVPRCVAEGTLAGRPYLIQDGMAGEALSSRLLRATGRRTAISLLQPSLKLLVAFSRVPGAMDELVADAASWNSVARLDYGLLPEDGELADPSRAKRLRESIARLQECPPRFLLHGDFWQTNLLVGRQGQVVGLIDWEFAAVGSAVPSDLVWFLVNACYYILMRDRPTVTIVEAFGDGFLDGGSCVGFVRDAVRRYCEETEFEPALFPDVVAVTLLQLANRERLAYGTAGAIDRCCTEMLIAFLDANPSDQVSATGLLPRLTPGALRGHTA